MSSLSSVGSSPNFNTLSNSSSNSGANSTGSSSGSSTNSSSLPGLNVSGVSFQGLVSGLNTDQIVQALLASQQQQITNLQNQQAGIVQRESIYNTIQADLTALQSAANGLSSTTNSVFDGRTATSSNNNVATASASSNAQPGVYSFTVNGLAQRKRSPPRVSIRPTAPSRKAPFSFRLAPAPSTLSPLTAPTIRCKDWPTPSTTPMPA